MSHSTSPDRLRAQDHRRPAEYWHGPPRTRRDGMGGLTTQLGILAAFKLRLSSRTKIRYTLCPYSYSDA